MLATIDRDKTRLELERLIAEAPQIAPSITRYDQSRDYGTTTDENLDTQRATRWELEAAAFLQQLAASKIQVFQSLHAEYLEKKEASKKYHSRSILVHQIMQLLVSALQLMDSTLGRSERLPSENGRTSAEPEPPKEVTIPWLLKHVPVNLWLAAVGLLFAVFVAGIKAGEISLVQEIFGINKTKVSLTNDAKPSLEKNVPEQRVNTPSVDCARLISTDGAPEARVSFKNYSNRTVAVYWINHNGAEKFYYNIGPKGELPQDTFVSHSWCIRDASNGQPVLAITITSKDQDVSIQ